MIFFKKRQIASRMSPHDSECPSKLLTCTVEKFSDFLFCIVFNLHYLCSIKTYYDEISNRNTRL